MGPGHWNPRYYHSDEWRNSSTLRASFSITASFFDDRDSGRCDKVYDCRCCEIRQYIKWDELFVETSGQPGPHGGFRNKSPNTWYEDRAERKTSLISGRPIRWRYGHRRDVARDVDGPILPHYFDDFGKADRWGCNYSSSDHPGGSYNDVMSIGGSWSGQKVPPIDWGCLLQHDCLI